MIWPFLFALVLGGLISAALYHAYLWPAVEPEKETGTSDLGPRTSASAEPVAGANLVASERPEPSGEPEVRGPRPEAQTDPHTEPDSQ